MFLTRRQSGPGRLSRRRIAAQRPAAQPEHRDFWDWLFGRDEPSRRQPPPREPPPSQRNYPPPSFGQDRGRGDPSENDNEGATSPRQVPHYNWRSDPRWQHVPPADNPDAGPDRRYGLDPNDPEN